MNIPDVVVNLKPLWAELFALEDEARKERSTVSADALDDGDELEISAPDTIARTTAAGHEILPARHLPSTASLTTFLVHVLHVLHWNPIRLDNSRKELDVVLNNRPVEGHRTFGIKT
jgi:hypothetical protein